MVVSGVWTGALNGADMTKSDFEMALNEMEKSRDPRRGIGSGISC